MKIRRNFDLIQKMGGFSEVIGDKLALMFLLIQPLTTMLLYEIVLQVL
jgi:hypothetical protein